MCPFRISIHNIYQYSLTMVPAGPGQGGGRVDRFPWGQAQADAVLTCSDTTQFINVVEIF